MRRLLATIAGLALCLSKLEAKELNAVYATQTTFHMSSPVIYTTTGVCIGKPSPFQCVMCGPTRCDAFAVQ